MSYSWVYIVTFELLASAGSPIVIKDAGGHLKLAVLAHDIRDAIDITEKKALKDGYLIAYIQSADRFDAEHYHREAHEEIFRSVERLEPQKNEIDWISTIVYD